MAENIVEVHNLVKRYGTFSAVDDISFVIPRGKIVGFLGPNGAGKTTTIQMLMGITSMTSGRISYFGKDFYQHKQKTLQRINFTSAFNTLQGRITVEENLVVFGYLYGLANPKKKIQQFVDTFSLGDLMKQRYMDLSAGQKTRVNIVKSLLNDPEILLMDEPTASLDPDIADKVLSYIEQMKKERELTILYTSHNMNEITRICDEVVFLDHGKIVAHDTPRGLTKRITEARLIVTFDGRKSDLENYLREKKQEFVFVSSKKVSITTEEKLIPKLLFGIGKLDVMVIDIEVEKPTLEDVFLQIARGGKHAV
jgi:ABC-2 type transport system ATP-binding protein